MATLTRHEKVSKIFEITLANKLNKSTMVFLLATMNDKALTKFYKELLEKFPEKID